MDRIIVETDLDMIHFLVLVKNLAEGYFDDAGEYQPHFGMLNAMRQFYNLCVADTCEFKKQYGEVITDATEMAEITVDYDFLQEFNEAITVRDSKNALGRNIDFDFANAFETALDIVETRKTSFTYVLEGIKKLVLRIVGALEDTLTEENLSRLSEIASKVDNAGDFANALVDAYGKSERFKDVTNSDKITWTT